jgi:hypothetical protein
MSKSGNKQSSVVKRTSQGGIVKTSTLNKTEKRSFKRYRGQGK